MTLCHRLPWLQWPSPIFLIGVALVLLSVFMYGRALDPRTLQLYWQRARKVRGRVHVFVCQYDHGFRCRVCEWERRPMGPPGGASCDGYGLAGLGAAHV